VEREQRRAAESAAKQVQGYCAQCKSRCGTVALVSADDVLLRVRPDRDHPNHGFCVKGAAAPEFVHNDGRLRFPLRRTKPKTGDDPGWARIGWDEALTFAADRLRALAERFGPETVVFTRPAPGGSQSGDWVSYLQRLAAEFGSPNVLTTGHICSWGRGDGSAYTYGRALPAAHFEAADTILIWGHNPAASHIQSWWRIREATRRGAKLVVIDPRATGTSTHADLWIRVRPGTDAALALGVVHLQLARGWFDRAFVTRWTNGPFLVDTATGRFLRAAGGAFLVVDEATGVPTPVDVTVHPGRWPVRPVLSAETGTAKTAFALLAEHVAPLDPARTSDVTGVPEADVVRLAEAIGTGGPLCYDTYNGVEQHTDTAQTARALGIMYALTGWLGAPGGNVWWDVPKPKTKARSASRPVGYERRPLGAARNSAQAYNVYDAVLTGDPYPIRALVAFGGNALLQNGDSRTGRRALESLDFHLHVDMFENPTARFADLLLPAATSWESPGLVTTFGGGPDTRCHAQYRAPVVTPRHESRPDIEVIFDLAVRLGLGDRFWAGDVDAAFEQRLAPLGITLADLKARPGGLRYDTDPPVFLGHEHTAPDGTVTGFRTPTRKVELYSETFAAHGYPPLPGVTDRRRVFAGAFPLVLTSNKLVQFTHSSGRGIPALRRQVPQPYLEIHPADAVALGVTDATPVRLVTALGGVRLTARLSDTVPRGVVSTQTGWWEACEELGLPGHDPFDADGANVNLIISHDVLDPISGSVPLKDYPCRVEPIDD
jgi:anaerobic selenocysteine-containing dehydrogenase